jgi:hypothetical protein
LATTTPAPEQDDQKYRKNSEGFVPDGVGLRAEHRMGEMMAAQAETVGKAKGIDKNVAQHLYGQP